MAYTKTSWIDRAVQFAKRYYMNSDGGNDKNLLPPFTDWTKHANAVINSDYSLTLTATAVTQQSYIQVPVIGGQQYTLSGVLTNSDGRLRVRRDSLVGANIATISDVVPTTTFAAPADVTFLFIVAYNNANTSGTYTFTNPQFEQATSATAFTPKKMYTITQSGGTVTAAGTPVNATNLNKMENALESIIGKDNDTIVETTSIKLETDTRNIKTTYTAGVLTKIEEKNGSTVLKTTNLIYTNGVLTSATEVSGGRTVTYALNYVTGALDTVTKGVV